MRFLFVTIGFLCFCLLSLSAQNKFSRFYEFGVKGSGYIVDTYVVDSALAVPMNGSNFGIRLVYVEKKYAGVFFEMTYNTVNYNKDGLNVSYKYLHFPLFTHFYFPMGDFSASIDLGPYGMALLEKNKPLVLENDFLYGIGGGVGVSYSLKNVVIGVDARYYFNMPSNSRDDDNFRSKWFEVSVNLGFRHLLK
ncbi:MAG: hypothetical protein JW717_10455 [Marinilabiliaceae bacterium]|nr:hypothetical protein [Marinilabiliaceae bacterium]